MAKDFIKGAIEHPGALTAAAKRQGKVSLLIVQAQSLWHS